MNDLAGTGKREVGRDRRAAIALRAVSSVSFHFPHRPPVERKRNETPTRGTKWTKWNESGTKPKPAERKRNEMKTRGTKAERNANPWNETGTKRESVERNRDETGAVPGGAGH
jgi:hypothetical protein